MTVKKSKVSCFIETQCRCTTHRSNEALLHSLITPSRHWLQSTTVDIVSCRIETDDAGT